MKQPAVSATEINAWLLFIQALTWIPCPQRGPPWPILLKQHLSNYSLQYFIFFHHSSRLEITLFIRCLLFFSSNRRHQLLEGRDSLLLIYHNKPRIRIVPHVVISTELWSSVKLTNGNLPIEEDGGIAASPFSLTGSWLSFRMHFCLAY